MLLSLSSALAVASDLPDKPLGEKDRLVLSDDFNRDTLGPAWKEHIASTGIENGAMFGRQTTKEHGSVVAAKLDLPDGNFIFECRFQLDRRVTIGLNFDEIGFKDSVVGHIARVTIEPQLIKLHDDKEGAMNRALQEMRKSGVPQKMGEAARRVAAHTQEVPIKLETTHWYQIGIEVVADEMRVTLDGKAIGCLKSSGLAHPHKPDLKISVSDRQALIDDLKVWSVKANQQRR